MSNRDICHLELLVYNAWPQNISQKTVTREGAKLSTKGKTSEYRFLRLGRGR
jgi:hypothetical protein